MLRIFLYAVLYFFISTTTLFIKENLKLKQLIIIITYYNEFYSNQKVVLSFPFQLHQAYQEALFGI